MGSLVPPVLGMVLYPEAIRHFRGVKGGTFSWEGLMGKCRMGLPGGFFFYLGFRSCHSIIFCVSVSVSVLDGSFVSDSGDLVGGEW